MNPRVPLFGLLLLGGAAWQAPAAAKPRSEVSTPSDQDRAVQLFQEGQKDYDAGDWATALEKFREVDSILTSPNARLYMARCLRELGRLTEAFELMTETVATANEKAKTDQSYLRTRDAAAAEREAIVPKIGRVTIAANAPPAGLVVKVGDRELTLADLGRELGVEPGTLVVTANAEGYESFTHTAELAPGGKTSVAIVMVREGQAVGPGGAPVETSDGWRTAGFVTMGVGVLGMGMFAITGLMANDRYATLEEECISAPCRDPKYQDVVDEGETLDLLANVGLGVGIGGLVLGTLMVAFGWPSEPSDGTEAAEGEESTEDAGEEPSEEVEQSASFGASPLGVFVGYELTF